VTTVRHACVACAAIWQILPMFIARHLWRTWRVVAHALGAEPASAAEDPRRGPAVPTRTVRRWRARWQRSAQTLTQVLAASGEVAWAALASRVGPEGTCGDLVAAYGRVTGPHGGSPVAAVAALVYRLHPRLRLV
jgi:hypothetical protein